MIGARIVAWIAALAILTLVSPALARVERYAVLVGNNVGARGDAELRFAEAEAARVQDVLRELGGFAPANTVLLRGESAESFRRTLITVNDRIRATIAGGDEAMLFVFYSGHADATGLHVGPSVLETAELEQLVRGSAATLRLLVVDACRSGALTRSKGGSPVAPFAIQTDAHLAGQGMVTLTSTAANEDAQESDQLQGSFFTQALVSGLLGAADTNRDGVVVLEEAYRYAYETTLRTTSRSWAGPQHPSFRFELRGQGNVVLTDLVRNDGARAALIFPPARAYMILAGASDGPVVAEVGIHDASRRLTLKPGRYFVRGRSEGFLLEGGVRADAGATLEVADALLERVEYARLVRKGGSDISIAHGPQAGYRVRTAIANTTSLCHGMFVGYPIDFRPLSVVGRVGACRGTFENATLRATSDELDLELRLVRSIDTQLFSIDLGVGFGGAVLHQTFTTDRRAPDRTSAAGYASASAGLTRDIGARFYVVADVEAQAYVFRLLGDDGETASTIASFALRPSIGLGAHF